MWLHLGTVANVWELCEDRVLIGLPADRGVLSMWAYHRTAPSCRPAGANLAFECVEPFVEWPSILKASACRSSYDATRTGALTDDPKSRVHLDLRVRAVTPVWDAEAVPATDTGAAMAEQSWAREHYEQLAHAHGHLIVDSDLIAFNGHVWRDHSRGPRGADTPRDWRGHVIASGVMPSGCGFGFSRYWTRDGRVTLEDAYVIDDQGLEHVSVDRIPGPAVVARDGEKFTASIGGVEIEVDAGVHG
ncbi:hypothetical protein MUNTM_35040 [Mycobacterium sp. MUNTM1]